MDNRTSNPVLKPCPFCGGVASYENVTMDRGTDDHRWGVGCTAEECIGFQWMKTYARKCDAAADWNKRAADEPSACICEHGPNGPPALRRAIEPSQHEFACPCYRAASPPDDDLYVLLVRRGYAQHEAFAISHMMPFPSGSAEPAGDAAAAAGAELTAALSTLQRIKGAFPEGDMRNHWVDLALIYLGPVAAEGASLTKGDSHGAA